MASSSDPAQTQSNAQSSARFRSATEFPKATNILNRSDLDAVYGEMRECLIFTNRSRAQLMRWNDQHKQDKLQLKETVHRLQGMIHTLTAEKQSLTQDHQQIVSELELEVSSMAIHLDRLSDAFEPFAAMEDSEQSRWSFVALPGRFFKFLNAVKSIVMWWRDEQDVQDETQISGESTPSLFGSAEPIDDDPRDRPQMYSDPASVNRSLLDR